MKIAYIGDSFCGEQAGDGWCYIVSKHYGATSIPLCQDGSNEYAILQRFKKLLSTKIIPDLIIFCHTDPYRLPNNQDLPLGSRCAKPPEKLTPIWQTAFDYYDHVINHGYHELSHRAVVGEILRLVEHHKLNVLHLRSFVPSDIGTGAREYDWDVEMNPSIAESLESIGVSKKINEPYVANHFNKEGNKYIAKLVIDKIDSLKLL
tara:strand:+ start:288 stop:902 length:615 start_codon:yes stop_codon:yes gene_type:complete